MTVHRGSYTGLGSAHQAVLDWCAAQGRRPAGPRWEVYGPHRDDPAQVWTEVYGLLAPGPLKRVAEGIGRNGGVAVPIVPARSSRAKSRTRL